MLRITSQERGSLWRLELAGRLVGPWVAETQKAWDVAPPGREIEVDLRQVTRVDDAGRRLLQAMVQKGSHLIAQGVWMTALVDEIKSAGARATRRHTTGKTHISVRCLLLAAMVAISGRLQAQQTAVPMRLTLRAAVNIALKQNPQVAIANLNLAGSQESRTIARAALLPSGSLNASENVQRINLSALIGSTFPGFPEH
jgi:hypothetical protein